MKNRVTESIILAVGIVVAALLVMRGVQSFTDRDRVVNVKGLAEMEVAADRVIWPLVYKEIGNDLLMLHSNIEEKNSAIVSFLKRRGITDEEITVAAPQIVDLQADRYSNQDYHYRYNATSVITVSSDKVDLIRELISKQSELLKQGVAITGDDYRYSVSYKYTRLNDIKPEMIEQATKNARAAAEKFASDSGSKVGKIRDASQGQFSISDRDENTPHMKNVRVVTTINYYLKN